MDKQTLRKRKRGFFAMLTSLVIGASSLTSAALAVSITKVTFDWNQFNATTNEVYYTSETSNGESYGSGYVVATKTGSTAGDCITQSSTTWTASVTYDDHTFTDSHIFQGEIDVTKHNYGLNAPIWSDDYSQCTVKIECSRNCVNGHTLADVTVDTTNAITTEPTTTSVGKKTYYANFDSSMFPTDVFATYGIQSQYTKVVDVPMIPTYSVTYDGNGATGGSVPTDTDTYAAGANVPLAENTGNLVKTNYNFIGWNTDPNATDKLNSYTMGNSNVTFYAIWQEEAPAPNGSYSVAYDGNGNTGGTAPTDETVYASGNYEVTVLGKNTLEKT